MCLFNMCIVYIFYGKKTSSFENAKFVTQLFILIVYLGEVIDTPNQILLEDLPIITPNGDIVVSSLSFKVGPI